LKADEVLSVGDAVKAHVFRYSAANKGFAISLRAEEKAKFYSEVEDGMILQVRLAARIFLYWAAAAKIQLLKALHSQ
jgi:exosome complex RNA-binding protein Rrp4